jgi:hypothetical protein
LRLSFNFELQQWFPAALLARERGKCFRFKSITPATCELDHVQSRINKTGREVVPLSLWI